MHDLTIPDTDLEEYIARALSQGATPKQAVTSAFGKWMHDNADAVQGLELANFYDGKDAPRAMVDYSHLVRFLAVAMVQQGHRIAELNARLAQVEQLRAGALPEIEEG